MMASTATFRSGDFSFDMIFGGQYGAGVICNPENSDPTNPAWLAAFSAALYAYPYIDQTTHLAENADRMPHNGLRNEPDEWLAEQIKMFEFVKGNRYTDWQELEGFIEAVKAERRKREARKKKAHSPTFRFSTGYVYLLQSPTGAYKIGRSRDPQSRLRTFQVKLPFEVSYVAVIQSENMYSLERELHNRFEQQRVNGEWFNLSPEDVEYIKSLQ